MSPQKQISIFLVFALLLCSYGCSAATVLNDIDIAAQAAAFAAPLVLALTPLPPGVQTMIISYVSAANAGIGCAASAAEASTDAATVSAAILKCLAGLNVAPSLPPGIAQNVAAAITALANDIAMIINKYGTPKASAARTGIVPSWKLTMADHRKVAHIHRTVEKTAGYLVVRSVALSQ